MEMLSALLLIAVAIALIAYAVITEATDWIGRAEIIEKRWPKLWRAMNNRPMRLILIIVALVMVAHVIQDLRAGETAPVVVLKPPTAPAIEKTKTEPVESPNSLRRRTMRLADEFFNFVRDRQEHHPPFAYPDSRDPNPSAERLKAIAICQKYDTETSDKYNRLYCDRLVGIIREYQAQGVPVGFLESSAAQGNIQWVPPGGSWEGGPTDQLAQFRNLAYRVDAEDHLIVLPY
jgi:hypothetical protein